MSTESSLHFAEETHPEDTNLQTSLNRGLQATRLHATQAADDIKHAVEARGREFLHAADDKAQQIKAKAEHVYSDAKGKAQEIRKDTEVYVKEHPLTSVCIALGAGFLIGMLARR